SGVEILANRPYSDGPGGSGQYTHKIYHVGSHIPSWFRALLPKAALQVEEESWNAYPYTRTRYTCPFVEKFSIEIETYYRPDAGQQTNVFNLSAAERAAARLARGAGQGPKPGGPPRRAAGGPLMCAYKLCKVEFRYWGMQSKIEQFIHDVGLRKVMLRAHRQAWCWQDEWADLTMEDIRQLEEETARMLAQKMAKCGEAEEPPIAGPSPEGRPEPGGADGQEGAEVQGVADASPDDAFAKQWSTSSRSSYSSQHGGERPGPAWSTEPISPELCGGRDPLADGADGAAGSGQASPEPGAQPPCREQGDSHHHSASCSPQGSEAPLEAEAPRSGTAALDGVEGAGTHLDFKVSGFFLFRNVTANHRASDVIVCEGKAQVLSGRFMYGPLDVVTLTGEKVDIYIMTQPLSGKWLYYGTEVTSGSGRLTFTIPPDKALAIGIYPVRMVVRGDHSYAEAYLTVVARGTESVVFSIDGSFTASVSIMGSDPKVRAGAVDVVRHWQDSGYMIIYVTGRPDMQKHSVGAWLSPPVIYQLLHIREGGSAYHSK
ncbi:PREDICTED: membrane-associated phosphatidylinositol transfer protein 1, partial [Aptenodytes forsteri]|uniref:membrane-associated phosphatidylinositol transfer protein 1 n=1 Tax=Aptenodytes forsteri TaxID=9233 RepID=UPI000905A243